MSLATRLRPRSYCYITFASTDTALLLRLAHVETYQHTLTVALSPRRPMDVTGVSQAIVAGPGPLLEAFIQVADAVCAMKLLRVDNAPGVKQEFGRWHDGNLTRSLANFAEVEAGRSLGDALLAEAAADSAGPNAERVAREAELVTRSRRAHSQLIDLDHLAMRCLAEPGEHDHAELLGLREARRHVGSEIRDVRLEFLRLNDGVPPSVWPV